MKKLIKKIKLWVVRKLGGEIYEWDIRVKPTNLEKNEILRAKQLSELHREYVKLYGESKADKMFEYFVELSFKELR